MKKVSRKKSMAAAIVFILLLSLAGCGNPASEEDEDYLPGGSGVSAETETLEGTEVLGNSAVAL